MLKRTKYLLSKDSQIKQKLNLLMLKNQNYKKTRKQSKCGPNPWCILIGRKTEVVTLVDYNNKVKELENIIKELKAKVAKIPE